MKFSRRLRPLNTFDISDEGEVWRIRRFFAFFPFSITSLTFVKETRWMERVTVIYSRDKGTGRWIPVCFE